jgi:DNA-3-methyladenine glycosylase
MRQRRPSARRNEQLASGPGKLTLALGITRAMNGADVTRGPLTVHEWDREKRVQIVTTPRIGITHCADWPLRFHVAGNAFISKRQAGPTGGRAAAPRSGRLGG